MPPWLDSGRLRSVELDRRGARALHRAVAHPLLRALLALASRLADGPLWAALIFVLPLVDPVRGAQCAWLVLALGTVNLLLYWCLKRGTQRQRPFEQCLDIRACMRVPDPFSFPSGHTLHAVAFAVLLGVFYPAWAPLLALFALLVGISRVVLGLHYPSDVLAGAAIGIVTAQLALLSI